MAQTMEERGHGKLTLSTRSGYKLKVGFEKKPDGRWKIWSIGAVNGITALLPFEISRMVNVDPFDTLEDAKWAMKSL